MCAQVKRAYIEQFSEIVTGLPEEKILQIIAYAQRIRQRVEEPIAPPLATPTEESGVERAQLERLAQVDAWIAQCDKVAELWEGEFDSAADLRRIRDEG